MNEKEILKKFSPQDFCCNMIDTLQDSLCLYLVIDYLPGGELFSLLKQQVFMSEDHSRFYVAEIIVAVETLHSMGIIYRDLKPENILIDKNGHIKLIDFGFAK
jgi:protein kinase A